MLALPAVSTALDCRAIAENYWWLLMYPIIIAQTSALFAGNEVDSENWTMLAPLIATGKLSAVHSADHSLFAVTTSTSLIFLNMASFFRLVLQHFG